MTKLEDKLLASVSKPKQSKTTKSGSAVAKKQIKKTKPKKVKSENKISKGKQKNKAPSSNLFPQRVWPD